MMSFGRVLTAMVTPFNADGSVNYDTAAALADHLIQHGSDGLVVCGTTGESPALTWAEEFELFRVIKGCAGDRAHVLAGTGSNSTREAIEATQKAQSLGLDGSLQVVPYYNKPPQEGLYRHFAAVALACPDMPLMLYNIPGRTGQSMIPTTVARLAELDNIVAIKEASGSLDQVSQIRAITPPKFAIYSGDDSLTLPLLSVGGCGVVSVASHLVGDRLQRMVAAYEAGQVAEATALHLGLFPLFKALFTETNPIPVKAALRLLGWDVGESRLPLCSASDTTTQALRQVLQDLQLIGP
ncbi:MAG: 4-hydroxy-tetrahydrodipicolinate synthase [Cyanobacteria bacterium P01_A01_bin.135]